MTFSYSRREMISIIVNAIIIDGYVTKFAYTSKTKSSLEMNPDSFLTGNNCFQINLQCLNVFQLKFDALWEKTITKSHLKK